MKFVEAFEMSVNQPIKVYGMHVVQLFELMLTDEISRKHKRLANKIEIPESTLARILEQHKVRDALQHVISQPIGDWTLVRGCDLAADRYRTVSRKQRQKMRAQFDEICNWATLMDMPQMQRLIEQHVSAVKTNPIKAFQVQLKAANIKIPKGIKLQWVAE
jgi:hypothetical protein